MGRKKGNSALLEASETAGQTVAFPTLPLEYKGRHCPKLSPADFWAATKAYPRNAVTCYKLYRLFPVIDRRLSGEELKDIANERDLDEKWILSRFGAGEYQVYFIDGNARPSSLCSTVVEIGDLWENPPVLNQMELVEGHSKNKGYIEGLKARNLWRRDELKEEKNEMAGAAAVEAANTAVQELAGIAKGAMARAGEKQAPDEAAAAVVRIMESGFKSVMTHASEVGNKGGGDMPAVIALLVKQMESAEARADRQHEEAEARAQRQHEAMLELMKVQRPAAGGSSIDGQLTAMDKMIAFAEKLTERVGGAARPASFMDRLPDLAVSLLPALLQRAAAAPPPPCAPAPYASLPTAAPGVPPAAAPVAAPPAENLSGMDEAMLLQLGFDGSVLPFIKVGQRAIKAYQEKYSGAAFAENVEAVDGEEMYAQLSAVGKDAILGALGKVAPMLGGQVAAVVASPEFAAWLDDFFAYGQSDEPAAPGGAPQ